MKNAIRALSTGRKRGITNRPSEIQDLSCAVLCRVVVNQESMHRFLHSYLVSCLCFCAWGVHVPSMWESPQMGISFERKEKGEEMEVHERGHRVLFASLSLLLCRCD